MPPKIWLLALSFLVFAPWIVLRLAESVRSSRQKAAGLLVDSLGRDELDARTAVENAGSRALWRAVTTHPDAEWFRFAEVLIGKGLLRKAERWFRHKKPDKRVEAVKVLTGLRTPSALNLTLTALVDSAEGVRQAAVTLLSGVRAAKIVLALVEAVPNMSDDERALLMNGWLTAGDELLPGVDLACRDASADARVWVADLIGRLRNPAANELLLRLAGDVHPGVRAHAAAGLGRIDPVFSGQALVDMLADGEWFVRLEAVKSLGHTGLGWVIQPLSRMLGDAEWWVRRETAQALSRLGEEGQAALVTAILGGEPLAKEAALDALAEMPLDQVVQLTWNTRAKADNLKGVELGAPRGAA